MPYVKPVSERSLSPTEAAEQTLTNTPAQTATETLSPVTEGSETLTPTSEGSLNLSPVTEVPIEYPWLSASLGFNVGVAAAQPKATYFMSLAGLTFDHGLSVSSMRDLPKALNSAMAWDVALAVPSPTAGPVTYSSEITFGIEDTDAITAETGTMSYQFWFSRRNEPFLPYHYRPEFQFYVNDTEQLIPSTPGNWSQVYWQTLDQWTIQTAVWVNISTTASTGCRLKVRMLSNFSVPSQTKMSQVKLDIWRGNFETLIGTYYPNSDVSTGSWSATPLWSKVNDDSDTVAITSETY